jgi:predicted TPR repeat methyltransferase
MLPFIHKIREKNVKMKNKDKDHALELLKGAYALKSSNDNKKYYKNFAPYYDSIFVSKLGYIYPKNVAGVLMTKFQIKGVICDLGCGTGLVAEEINKINSNALIDGVDISKEMIEISRNKKLYRNLFEIDLKTNLVDLPKDYDALVSAGTFTHGHLGPDVMRKIILHLKTETCVVFGINYNHFNKKGFKSLFDSLIEDNKIRSFQKSLSHVYDTDDDIIDHNDNKSYICSFQIF